MSNPKLQKSNYNIKEFYLLEKFCRRTFIWPDSKLICGYLHPITLSLIVQIMAETLYLIHLIQSLKIDSAKVILNHVLVFFCSSQVLIVQMGYLISRKQCLNLLHEVDELKRYDVPMEENKLSRRIVDRAVWAAVIYVVGAVLFSGVFVYFYVKFCKSKSLICVDVVSIWFPWNQEVFTSAFVLVLYPFAMQGCIMCTTFLVCQVAFIEMLIFRLLSLTSFLSEIDFRKRGILRKRLRTCVLFYNDLVWLNKKANFCWARCEQFSNFGYSLTLSLAAIVLFVNPTYQEPLIIFFWFSICFIHYNMGQRLVDASNALVDAAYQTNWYEGDVASQKDLLTFMMLAQKPLRIGYRHLEDISHSSLSKLLSLLFSYLITFYNFYDSMK